MTEAEKEQRAEERAQERLEALLERERQTQAKIALVSLGAEDQYKIDYLNGQLLRLSRSDEWKFLRGIRNDILRHYNIGGGEDATE